MPGVKFGSLSLKEILLKYRRIDEITGCWLWTRGTNRQGYGTVELQNKGHLVHRLSYEEFIGPLTNLALHKTNCPNKHCFNPDHLYDGTYSDNTFDRVTTKTHSQANKTHCPQGHEYNKENTRHQSGRRVCRICENLRSKEFRKQRKEKLIAKSQLAKNDLA